MWSRIYDLIIKTIISIEPIVVDDVRKYSLTRANCFDLLGFDVLLDSDLKPWLMEVNLSPSMNTDSPLDHRIKSNLIADTFTLIGIKKFDRKGERMNILKTRLNQRVQLERSQTPGHTRDKPNRNKVILRETLEEFERRGNFVRIYPSKGTNYYD